jgi:hypothetical protein
MMMYLIEQDAQLFIYETTHAGTANTPLTQNWCPCGCAIIHFVSRNAHFNR